MRLIERQQNTDDTRVFVPFENKHRTQLQAQMKLLVHSVLIDIRVIINVSALDTLRLLFMCAWYCDF